MLQLTLWFWTLQVKCQAQGPAVWKLFLINNSRTSVHGTWKLHRLVWHRMVEFDSSSQGPVLWEQFLINNWRTTAWTTDKNLFIVAFTVFIISHAHIIISPFRTLFSYLIMWLVVSTFVAGVFKLLITIMLCYFKYIWFWVKREWSYINSSLLWYSVTKKLIENGPTLKSVSEEKT